LYHGLNLIDVIQWVSYVTIGFLQYGGDTKSDLLLSYPATAPLTFVMTLATYINTLAAYPVSHYTLRFIIVELFTGHGPDDTVNYSTPHHVLVALVVLILCTIGAFVLPNIGMLAHSHDDSFHPSLTIVL
jgi:hypothetical protein